MHIGQYISGAGHVGLITWVLFGGAFSPEEQPFEVTEISVISAEDFAALSAPQASPDTSSDAPTLTTPEAEVQSPDVSSEPDVTPQTPEPPVTEAAQPDPQPVPVAAEPPLTEVDDTPPVIEPPSEDVAVLMPPQERPPAARQAPRVAPEPVAPPEPDVKIDDVVREELTPDQPAQQQIEPETATAPQEATSEIVTEAEKDQTAAPARSLRPKARPRREVARAAEPKPATRPVAKPAAKPDPKPINPAAGVNAALAEALGQAQASPDRPLGPPMTRGEQDALRVAVQNCWLVDVGSRAADVVVTIAMSMDRSGKVVGGSLKMLTASAGDDKAVKSAFEAARRAVMRCQKGGYDLPDDKYDHWRDIEMTFNPEKMRIK